MQHAERVAHIRALNDWVREVRDGLGLCRWRIDIMHDEPDDSTCIAEFHRHVGCNDGRLFFGDTFFDLPAEQQRETLVHELLHAHMRPLFEVFYDLDELLGKAAYEVIARWHNAAEETIVDGLAKAIAEHFPLPPEPAATPVSGSPPDPDPPAPPRPDAGPQQLDAGEAGNWYETIVNACPRCGAAWRATGAAGYTITFDPQGRAVLVSPCPRCGLAVGTPRWEQAGETMTSFGGRTSTAPSAHAGRTPVDDDDA